MSDKPRCCCRHTDARACYEARYPRPYDPDDSSEDRRDERCECHCHVEAEEERREFYPEDWEVFL